MRHLSSGEFLADESRTIAIGEVLVSHTRYLNPVYEGWHSHRNMHFSYALDGGNIEQRRADSIKVSRGSVLVYQSGETHCNSKTEHPSQNIIVELPPEFLASFHLKEPELKLALITHPEASLVFANIFKELQLRSYLGLTPTASIQLYALSLLELASSSNMCPRDLHWSSRIYEVIHDRWNDDLSLSDIAKDAGVHPVTVSRYFSHYFGYNLGDYLRMLRITHALQLIRSTGMSLTEIAHHCGFFDQSHFIKAFKLYMGITPSNYRKLR
jgi:AraC family transcriptional regulator